MYTDTSVPTPAVAYDVSRTSSRNVTRMTKTASDHSAPRDGDAALCVGFGSAEISLTCESRIQ